MERARERGSGQRRLYHGRIFVVKHCMCEPQRACGHFNALQCSHALMMAANNSARGTRVDVHRAQARGSPTSSCSTRVAPRHATGSQTFRGSKVHLEGPFSTSKPTNTTANQDFSQNLTTGTALLPLSTNSLENARKASSRRGLKAPSARLCRGHWLWLVYSRQHTSTARPRQRRRAFHVQQEH